MLMPRLLKAPKVLPDMLQLGTVAVVNRLYTNIIHGVHDLDFAVPKLIKPFLPDILICIYKALK